VSETNGRIRLTWQQIVWGISLIALIVGSWADLRSQINQIKTENAYLRERLARLERMTGYN